MLWWVMPVQDSTAPSSSIAPLSPPAAPLLGAGQNDGGQNNGGQNIGELSREAEPSPLQPPAPAPARSPSHPPGGAHPGVAAVAVVIPTFNEVDNVAATVAAVAAALATEAFELVFVDDDSTDGTHAAITALARRDPRIRLLHRIGRRGLSSAVVEGVLSTTAPFVAVMDADLQHDERLLPHMLAALRDGDADIIVGSRYAAGGGIGQWDSRRAGLSRLGTRLARMTTRTPLADPLSGFFMITRDAFDGAARRLSLQGYKILVDVMASAPSQLRVRELAYAFRPRRAGVSKLDTLVAWEYATLLLDKTIGQIVPVRFVMFAAVGGLGVVVHMAVLAGVYRGAGIEFAAAQTLAAVTAMTFNFALNNQLTYRDRRRRGLWGLVKGLASFCAVCSIGAVANVGIADFLFDRGETSWWLAGIAGIAVGAVWNYAASAVFTWRR